MTTQRTDRTAGRRLVRFFVGVAILGGVFALIVGTPLPGGKAGAFLEQTEAMDIQATALFYADLERFSEIEGRLYGEDGYRDKALREKR